jgi:ubiquinone/menaquinone biosynthesis C-methylase UbiE
LRPSTLRYLRCPQCTAQLQPGDEWLVCEAGHSFAVDDRIPDLVYPRRLLDSDAEFQLKYNQGAGVYDTGLDWLFGAFYEDEQRVREDMIGMLELAPGDRVLETGCGTGKDSVLLAERIGESGELFVQDISIEMLRLARERLADSPAPVEFVLSNASYLPFADDVFDAAFHFGGVNTFSELRRALSEITRVVRPGGRVVVGDEGLAPWLRRKLFGRILVNANPLYAHRPPLEHLPVVARDVTVRWILGNAFYLIAYRVGEAPPPVDLDRPIPGKGDTLRSRYYGNTAENRRR